MRSSRLTILGLIALGVGILCFLPTINAFAQSGDTPIPTIDAGGVALIALAVIVLLGLPVVYVVANRKRLPMRALLIVSTDEEAAHLVARAARRVGYQAVTVYRYEDALEKLRLDATLSMVVIDDSVPQYEAGMLVYILPG